MVAFPPGFPFVSRAPAPEPEPQPEPLAAAESVAEEATPDIAPMSEPLAFAEPQIEVQTPPAAALPPESASTAVRNTQPIPAPISAPGAQQERVPAAPAQAPAGKAVAAPPIATKDRRKVKRDSLATAALLRIDGVHGPPLKIELADISIAGARFRAPYRLDVDEKAQIRVEIGPFRWTTRLRVVHCSPVDEAGGATIGCAFLRTELLRPWPVAA